jgi:hypothetical protein
MIGVSFLASEEQIKVAIDWSSRVESQTRIFLEMIHSWEVGFCHAHNGLLTE